MCWQLATVCPQAHQRHVKLSLAERRQKQCQRKIEQAVQRAGDSNERPANMQSAICDLCRLHVRKVLADRRQFDSFSCCCRCCAAARLNGSYLYCCCFLWILFVVVFSSQNCCCCWLCYWFLSGFIVVVIVYHVAFSCCLLIIL